MGNLVSSIENATTLKTNFDNEKKSQDAALSLANGDLAVKQKLTVAGTSTFNDDITLATGKKLNGIDVATLSTNIGTLETSIKGMNNAVSGDFTGKAISGASAVTASGAGTFGSVTTTGAGSFGSVKTSDVDINGNITSSAGKSFITTADATGIRFTNGLPVTDAKYAYQTIDTATGDITIAPGTGKKVSVGGGSNKVTMFDGVITASSVNPGSGLYTGWYSYYITPNQVKYGTTTTLNKDSLTVPAVIASGAVTAGSVTNSGALTNTGALKIGGNKWLINEVVSSDATKGTRLCFGAEDSAGKATYWTCMNKDGNLERF